MRRALITLVCAGGLLAVPGVRAAAAGGGPAVALLTVQDRVGDPAAARAVEQPLREELSRFSRLRDAGSTRDVQRRLRLRNGNDAPPELLRRVAEELGADWLVAVTLHEARRRGVPSVTLSAHAYRGDTGELSWAGFRGGSGLDGRSVLGLGEVHTLELLAPRVVRRLTADLEPALAGGSGRAERTGNRAGGSLGSVAVVPFGGLTARDATSNAETLTEAARAALQRLGTRTVSPGCANDVLRRQRLVGWGGVDADARSALRETCGADTILTGSVERYELAGGELEPEPRVSVAARLIETDSGRIVWTGAVERGGWDRQGVFRLGRIHSLGALADETMGSLARRLLRERSPGSDGRGVEK